MSTWKKGDNQLEFHPLTPERWPNLEQVFGATGGDDGCWCMWWRQTQAEFKREKGDRNKARMKAIVEAGPPPGILAYMNGQPAAWCSLAPRETYPKLNRTPRLKSPDGASVWSIVCFYVAPHYRGQGIMEPMIQYALQFAKGYGAKVVEAYPVEFREGMPAVSGYMGLVPAFRKVGFVEVLRRTENQPIMRCFISD